MGDTYCEHIPSTKIAAFPTDSIVQNVDDDDDENQPSVPAQPTINQTTIEHAQLNTYRLELSVSLLFFSWNLSATVFQNQVVYQSCELFYNESTCNLLANENIPDSLKVISFSE